MQDPIHGIAFAQSVDANRTRFRDNSSVTARPIAVCSVHSEGGFMAVATISEPKSNTEKSKWLQIAEKAYELYEERGRRDGYALQDWLDAEDIINREMYEDWVDTENLVNREMYEKWLDG
jgi:hypothetical protein